MQLLSRWCRDGFCYFLLLFLCINFWILNLALKNLLACSWKVNAILAWHLHNLCVLTIFGRVFIIVYFDRFHLLFNLKFLKVKITFVNFAGLLCDIWAPLIDKDVILIIESNDEILLKFLKKLLSFKLRLYFIRICISGSVKCHKLILLRTLFECIFPRSSFCFFLYLLFMTWIHFNPMNSVRHLLFMIWNWIVKSKRGFWITPMILVIKPKIDWRSSFYNLTLHFYVCNL